MKIITEIFGVQAKARIGKAIYTRLLSGPLTKLSRQRLRVIDRGRSEANSSAELYQQRRASSGACVKEGMRGEGRRGVEGDRSG